ncbi:MAG: hypothetical protein L0H93_18845, partial [Nocardioides sp.]|nr:hypothetical protein [Nocardioides sp.]
HVLVNYLAVLGLCLAWWQRWATWWAPLAVLTVVGLVYTIGRAARQVPARRKAIESLYASTGKHCGHPRISRTNPTDPATRIMVRRWKGPKRPRAGAIVYEGDSAAAAPATRWMAEKSVEQILGEATVFDYTTQPGYLLFEMVTADDQRLTQKRTRRWVESTVSQLFPARRGANDTFDIDLTWGDGGTIATDTPVQVDVGFGAYDVSARDFRDKVERGFDAGVNRGPECIYDWSTPGLLAITGVDPSSGEATRKRLARKISDVVVGAVTRAAGRQAAGQAQLQVTRWVPEGKGAANTPVEVTVVLGTADFSSILTQQQLESSIDQALETEWTDRVWLPDWVFGAEASLTLNAVPRGHQMALRKTEERRLRQVVSQKFKVPRGGIPVDLDVHEWVSDKAGDTIVAERAAQLTIRFGTVDVTKADDRRAFQDHFDSLAEVNDWRYEWQPHQGTVAITAVTSLPSHIHFPAEGTPECERWHQMFREGRILLGPAKGGYEAVIKLGTSPHTLVGGSTGAGKSVLLGMVLYGTVMNPDLCELVTLDPKVTDWTAYTKGAYPNIRASAPTDARTAQEEINTAITYANNEMMRRQNLIRAHEAENLDELRRLAADGVRNIAVEDVPKRMILFFDEIGSAFTMSKDPDIKALQEDSRTKMEEIAQLARAMQVNIFSAAQKPSNENIGTLMRGQMGNRVGIGKLDIHTSIQVMDNALCSELDESAPKGRGWYVNDMGQELLVQTFLLPKRTQPCPVPGCGEEIQGIEERVAARLSALGYTPIKVPATFVVPPPEGSNDEPTQITIQQTQWVRADRIDTDD